MPASVEYSRWKHLDHPGWTMTPTALPGDEGLAASSLAVPRLATVLQLPHPLHRHPSPGAPRLPGPIFWVGLRPTSLAWPLAST
eukprot:scaffold2045_cov404-Prasinococcus_capsulatus_cf.AAC.3